MVFWSELKFSDWFWNIFEKKQSPQGCETSIIPLSLFFIGIFVSCIFSFYLFQQPSKFSVREAPSTRQVLTRRVKFFWFLLSIGCYFCQFIFEIDVWSKSIRGDTWKDYDCYARTVISSPNLKFILSLFFTRKYTQEAIDSFPKRQRSSYKTLGHALYAATVYFLSLFEFIKCIFPFITHSIPGCVLFPFIPAACIGLVYLFQCMQDCYMRRKQNKKMPLVMKMSSKFEGESERELQKRWAKQTGTELLRKCLSLTFSSCLCIMCSGLLASKFYKQSPTGKRYLDCIIDVFTERKFVAYFEHIAEELEHTFTLIWTIW